MKKTISRNIAIVSAIFMVTFSIMLVTNYFKVSGTDPLQTIEILKQANEEVGENPQLQEQIRELDLLARRAYFISIGRLRLGVAILLMMVIVFVISLRIYFAKSKDIPNKDIDPIDNWAIQSKTRAYIVWIACGLAISGIIFALLTSSYLKKLSNKKSISETETVVSDYSTTDFEQETQAIEQAESVEETDVTNVLTAIDTLEISNVTHSGFRGNNSLGISPARNVPTTWNLATGKNILWRVPIPRKGYNSPIISGNRVFFTGADEDVRELFCYELSSGKLLWRLEAKNIPGSPSRAPATTDDTGLGAPTAATNGKVVCAIFGTGDVICADMNGKQLWAKNLGVPDNAYGFASSLLIYGNLLIIQYDNRNSPRVVALDLANGNERWSRPRPERNPSWSSPTIAMVNNRPQLILVGNPGITSYNPNTGEQNWRVEAMAGEPAPGAAYANGIVFAGTEYATLVAINATDGTILWRNNEILPEISSPVATRDFVFVATSYGVVASFDPQTGKVIKSMELGADFNASPIIVEGKIYLICTKGKVYIFSAQREFTLINSFETGEKTFATPAFTDRKIVIRTEKSIYCVKKSEP
ncbi:MAG: PQQ-binding-like beta-propeller repeat protein [Bacteroidales bacterium]|jgi:outer membrane protein assembly factor BamB|nr:PQQ-binding-like beta-propeller repeat protein [Bacteroidales bacterium]